MAIQRVAGNSLTAQEVLAYAQRISQTRADVGIRMCQRFVRSAFGSPGGAPTALAAWAAAQYKHKSGTPPPGAAVFWGGGSAGHVAISAGNGMVYSTDVKEPGKVDLVSMDYITKQWGKPLLGWTEDNNGKRITTFNAKPVQEGAGGKFDPVYSGNSTTQGGPYATGYSKKELRERYGYIAEVYEGIPEIQQLVKRAIKAGWTEDEFDRRFQASKWYKNHTEEEKQWVLNKATNPAELEQQVNQRKTDVVNMYRQMGVPVGKARLDKIAEKSIKHGWSDQQLRNALAAEFDYNPEGTFGGVAGQTIDELRSMADSYVIPLSNKTIDRWTQNVLRGEATPDDFASYMKDQAKSLWDDPQMQAAIDRGQTVRDYLAPWQELAARELEISPDDVDWTAPRWSQAIFRTNDKGERRIASFGDWQRTIRTDPKYGYDKTSQAREQAAEFANSLATMFGRVG